MAHANDNMIAPISGKKSHQWPAMARAIKDRDLGHANMLRLFETAWHLANTPPDAVASVTGKYEELAAAGIANIGDEAPEPEAGEASDAGCQIDFCVEYGKTPEALYELTKFYAYTNLLPDGRKGAEHNPNFRIRHASYNAETDGEITETFHSWAEYRSPKDGKWYRLEESLKRPRGKARDNNDALTWTHTVHPSGNGGATYFECVSEERLNARQQLEWLRREIGDVAFEHLRLAAIEKSTAKPLGEAHGEKHKPASALGTKLIKDALTAANDNWPKIAVAS
jgi:hypothetical protein